MATSAGKPALLAGCAPGCTAPVVEVISRGDARRKRNRLLRNISNYGGWSQTSPVALEGLRSEIERYFSSVTARTAIIHERWPDLDPSQVDQLANGIDASTRCQEFVRYFRKAKGPGRGWRTICEFPRSLVVRHQLIKDVVETALPTVDEQYLKKGRGHGAAVIALKAAIEGGREFVLTADVRSAFASVKFDALYDLTVIPSEVLRWSLDPRHLNLRPKGGGAAQRACIDVNMRANFHIHSHRYIMDAMSAPTGILEGSVASNSLFAWLLRDIGDCAPAGSIIVVFSDNIAVACPSSKDREVARSNLIRFAADHPAGPFTLQPESQRLEEGFNFLGHRLARYADTFGVTVEPTYRNLEKIIERAECMAIEDATAIVHEPAAAIEMAVRELSPYWGLEDWLVDALADKLWFIAAGKLAHIHRG